MNNLGDIIERIILNKFIFFCLCIVMTPSFVFAGGDQGGDYLNELTAVVEEVYVVESESGEILKPWCVAVAVEKDKNNEINAGEKIKIYIHSVYKTFRSQKEEVIGKKYKFYVYEPIVNNQYDGRLKVRPSE